MKVKLKKKKKSRPGPGPFGARNPQVYLDPSLQELWKSLSIDAHEDNFVRQNLVPVVLPESLYPRKNLKTNMSRWTQKLLNNIVLQIAINF